MKTNGTIDKVALAKALAEKTGQDISLANYFLDALNEITGTHEVHIEGEKTGIDTENADEHVHLVRDDAHRYARRGDSRTRAGAAHRQGV